MEIHPVIRHHSAMSLKDSLSASMEPFRYKMEKFRERHDSLRYRSIRLMRKNMLQDNEAHVTALGKALQKLTSNSEAAIKVNGINVLMNVRTAQIDHARKFRENPNPGANPGIHVFEPLINEGELHSMSPLKRKVRFQIEQLQYLGADFEAVTLIYYLEDRMIKERTMTEEQRLRVKSRLLKLTPKGEYYLNELRSLLCG